MGVFDFKFELKELKQHQHERPQTPQSQRVQNGSIREAQHLVELSEWLESDQNVCKLHFINHIDLISKSYFSP